MVITMLPHMSDRYASSSLGLKLSQKVVYLVVVESPYVSLAQLPWGNIVLFLLAETSATYERCCVLFNIGALQSQIAKAQNFDSDEGLKTAAKHFQVSWLGDIWCADSRVGLLL